MKKVRKTIKINAQLWNQFENKLTGKYGKCRGHISKSIEESISLWLEQDKLKNTFKETTEYLHWITAIACKFWIDDEKNEAKILFEATRRIASQLHKSTPNVIGIHIFATAFVNPNNDLIVSNYPWALICYLGNDEYLVRLIIHRCTDNTLLCGSNICPCLDLEDCDKVEVGEKVKGTMDDALNTLAKLYLSYFFSKRAYDDGIGSRAEINDEYWSIRDELDKKGILIGLNSRDERKLEEIRKCRSEKHKKAHLELVNIVVKDYKERLPKEIEKWRQRFIEEWGVDEELKSDFTFRMLLWNSVESLNFVYSTLNRIYEKSKRKKESKRNKIAYICSDVINLLNDALNQLYPAWDKDKLLANCTTNTTKLKIALENLQNVLKLISKSADKLVKVDIDRGAVAYDNSLAYSIRALVRAITGIEEYLKTHDVNP